MTNHKFNHIECNGEKSLCAIIPIQHAALVKGVDTIEYVNSVLSDLRSRLFMTGNSDAISDIDIAMNNLGNLRNSQSLAISRSRWATL